MLLRRRGLTGQRYDLVGADGEVTGVRLRPLRQGATVTTGDGSGWRIDRAPRLGAWHTQPIDEDTDEPLVTVVKGFAREHYELDWAGGHLVFVRRRGRQWRRMDLLDARGTAVGEVVLTTLFSGAYDLRLPVLPDAVVATVAFLVVLLNRRDNAAAWS